jgi:CYTH domain-containing protein
MTEITQTKIEIERRYLVPLPLKWYGKFRVLTSPCNKIVQTYLKEHGGFTSRIRAEVSPDYDNLKTKYTYARKNYASFGTYEEMEKAIPHAEYCKYLRLQDLSKKRIEKTRYHLDFKNQKFELDVFQGHLTGLSILEIEVDDINTDILLPPYLKINREITGEAFYSNVNLSGLNCYYP